MARQHSWGFGTTARFLAATKAFNEDEGRVDCRLVDYIEAHIDDPVDDVVDAVYADSELGPEIIVDGMWGCLLWERFEGHSLEQAVKDQENFADALRAHRYEHARTWLEPMMKSRRNPFLSRKALECVLAYIRDGHPNPKAFLMKPEVLAKLPADLDLTDWPCPDFPALALVPVKGLAA